VFLEIHLQDRVGVVQDAGRRHQGRNRPHRCLDFRRERDLRVKIRHVAVKRLRGLAGRCDVLGDPRGTIHVDVDHRDGESVRRESPRARLADTATAPGDNRNVLFRHAASSLSFSFGEL
jgi:hypothetical protein